MVPAESFHRWFAVFALSLFLGKTLNNLPLIFIWGSSIHHTRTLDFSLGNESLFLQHLNTHLLTLTPAPEQIKRCWKDARSYFLVYAANKPEYKKVLPQNEKILQISEALKYDTNLLLHTLFLVEIAPIFAGFLTGF